MKQHIDNQWVVVTVNKPVLWTRAAEETWILNPPRRYVMNACHLASLEGHVEAVSDLKGAGLYRPLRAGAFLPGARVLVERCRERGIGDLLFMTGPLSYIQHVTGGTAQVDFYALAERGHALAHHPALRFKTTLAGPLHYDDFPLYDYHWMVDTVTEHQEDADQLNVYDALYAELGFDPASIPADFKRPSMQLTEGDTKNLDQFYYYVHSQCPGQLDLRRVPYYVVCPFSNATLRSMPYPKWLELIQELSKRAHVVVLGNVNQPLPASGCTAGEFVSALTSMGPRVINALGWVSLRTMAAIISKSKALVCLDSGPLYVAQALRVPAVSLWGPHDPRVRIGYDPEYMASAVWERQACRYAPCFAYSGFPVHKCPEGAAQSACQVLSEAPLSQVLAHVDRLARVHAPVGPIPCAK